MSKYYTTFFKDNFKSKIKDLGAIFIACFEFIPPTLLFLG